MTSREFFKQVAVLMSGKAGVLAISLMVIPVLSRIYEPDDFGAVAVFIVLTNLLTIVLPLRYFRAAIVEPDEKDSLTLFAMSSWCLLMGTAVLALVIALIKIGSFDVQFIEPLGNFIWLLPVSILLVGFAQIISTMHVKQKSFAVIARSDISESVLSAIFRVGYGLIQASLAGLVVGYLVGSLGRLLVQMRNMPSPLALLLTKLNSSDVKRLARDYDEYPLHSMPSGLLVALSAKMPILLLAAIYSPAIVGFYAMADRLVRAPVLVVSTSVREVFLRKLTGGRKRTTYLKPFWLMTLGMFIIGIAPFGVMALVGGEVMVFILGDRWVEAGEFVEILAPWYFSTWVITGVQPSLVAMRRQSVWLKMTVLILVVRGGVLSMGFYSDSTIQQVMFYYAYSNVILAVLLLVIVTVLMSRHATRPEVQA